MPLMHAVQNQVAIIDICISFKLKRAMVIPSELKDPVKDNKLREMDKKKGKWYIKGHVG